MTKRYAFEPISRRDPQTVLVGFVPSELDTWDYQHPRSGEALIKTLPSGKTSIIRCSESYHALPLRAQRQLRLFARDQKDI